MSLSIKIVAGVLMGIVALVFLLGLLLALFSDVDQAAPRVQIIRDIFIIILALQGIFVIGALAVLILQIARLINLLQNEVMPILKNTEETVNTARGTVEFVGSNLAEPVIRVNGFLVAISVLLRELFGIRRALRRTQGEIDETDRSKS
ncbi:MAG: hypothetical protein K8J31_21580 [Anaerolineae bacterium]|nr:hypothetical protein [Anaerolineae bacterium]